ncbi:hypothetical protein [Roseovarius salinarum]|uniref:hypothetical protein n=1 Tax=Roseovarius salinarum TaxID=1981892 RepID=UPI000C31FBA1|nr:hypothetical protein [Roseovarius salinarum]
MTDEIIRLADNLIGLSDRQALESYGAHVIGHGWATRFAWAWDADGDPHFDIFSGGADEVLAARIGRDRAAHVFYALDAEGARMVEGTLDHVMAELDRRFAAAHGQGPTPA